MPLIATHTVITWNIDLREGTMQTTFIKPHLVVSDLLCAGLTEAMANNFRQQNMKHFFKLRHIPKTIIAPLQQLFENNSATILFYQESSADQDLSSAIVAAGEKELSQICLEMKTLGGYFAQLETLLNITLQKLQSTHPIGLHLGDKVLPLGSRTIIMGILNVTPDSFSDGGRYDRVEEAVAQAFRMAEQGADIIDIGGESTRPGHQEITVDEELQRVMPVIQALKKERSFKLPLSIDSYKAAVAEAVLAAGVEMLNDVWGLKKDNALGAVAARYKVPICLMHNRSDTDYADLIPDIIVDLEESIALAHQAGIKDSDILIDPGIGFGKNLAQNLEVMRRLSELCCLGYPLLLGTSRKSLIGKTLDLPADQRLEGTAATVACGIAAGAAMIRVHDVLEMKRVAIMTDAMTRR
jgi:dihydropteroate synthase